MARTTDRLTDLQRNLESVHGQPIETVIRDALRIAGRERTGIRGAARRLSIAHTTLIKWLADFGIDAQAEMARGILSEVA